MLSCIPIGLVCCGDVADGAEGDAAGGTSGSAASSESSSGASTGTPTDGTTGSTVAESESSSSRGTGSDVDTTGDAQEAVVEAIVLAETDITAPWMLPGDFLTVRGQGFGDVVGTVRVAGVEQPVEAWSSQSVSFRLTALGGLAPSDAAVVEVETSDGAVADAEAWLNLPLGFGAETVGGLDAAAVTMVTSGADSGPGTLRDALAGDGPRFIRFPADAALDVLLESPIRLPSNVTIDGRGARVVIRNARLESYGAHNLIVSNLAFADSHVHDNCDSRDGLSFRAPSIGSVEVTQDVFVDHCTTTNMADEHIEIGHNSRDITIAWHHFRDAPGLGRRYQVVLGFSANQDDSEARLTMHHSWFDHGAQRQPRVRDGHVHLLNNLFTAWEDYAVGVDDGARVLAEGNIFDSDDSDAILAIGDGAFASSGNVFLDAAVDNPMNTAGVPAVPYRYDVDVADEGLREAIEMEAGARFEFAATPFDDGFVCD